MMDKMNYRWIRYGFSLLVVGVLIYYIYLHRSVIAFSDIVNHKMTIAASMMMLTATFFACSFGWVLILRRMKLNAHVGEAVGTWFISQLGKYIPGKVWVLVGRLYLLPGKENKVALGCSIIVEMVLVNVTGFFLFLCSLFLWDQQTRGVGRDAIAMGGLLVLALMLLNPRALERIVNTVLNWLGRNTIEIRLKLTDMAGLFIYYIFCWILYGFSFAILASAFTEMSLARVVVFSGIYVISVVIGFVTLIAPSGLGVREGVLFMLLSRYMDAPLATYLSVVSRIWFTAVELAIVAFLLFGLKHAHGKPISAYHE